MLPVLVFAAIACIAASVALILFATAVPAAVAHLAFAAGIMPLIFGAVMHFVPVLTRSHVPGPVLRLLPLLASGAGLLVVSAFFVPGSFNAGIHAAALLALIVTLIMAVWIVGRARAALDSPHPCLYWYLAAVLCLALALVAVLAMTVWPSQHAALRIFHLHLNTLGFIGLTAIGTLQVLLPTAVGRHDQEASTRLRSDLPLAVAGVLLVAGGSAWLKPLAYVGMVPLLFVVTRLGFAWARRFPHDVGRMHGAASSLALALFGLFVLLFVAPWHADHGLSGSDALFGFVLAFLLSLVTGAVSQLLPLWLRPGVQTAWHHELRSALTRFGGIRALAFVVAGISTALGWRGGAWLGALALVAFAGQLLRAFARP